jgi:hypothetical protein
MSVETLNEWDEDLLKTNLLELKEQILGKKQYKKNNKRNKEKQDSEPRIIPATREYKIYRL